MKGFTQRNGHSPDLADEAFLAAADMVQSLDEEGDHLAGDELFSHQLSCARSAEVQIIPRSRHTGCHGDFNETRE